MQKKTVISNKAKHGARQSVGAPKPIVITPDSKHEISVIANEIKHEAMSISSPKDLL